MYSLLNAASTSDSEYPAFNRTFFASVIVAPGKKVTIKTFFSGPCLITSTSFFALMPGLSLYVPALKTRSRADVDRYNLKAGTERIKPESFSCCMIDEVAVPSVILKS